MECKMPGANRRRFGAVLSGMMLPAVVFAQPVHKGVVFEAVEATVADMDPLSLGQRVMRADQRLPSGFDRVFRVHVPGGEPVFARIANGVTAVFPRSAYAATEAGLQATIPPGTIFSIGGDLRALLPASVAAPSARRNWAGASMFADRSVNRSGKMPSAQSYAIEPYADTSRSILRESDREPADQVSGPVTIWNSEMMRRRRLTVLLAL